MKLSMEDEEEQSLVQS